MSQWEKYLSYTLVEEHESHNGHNNGGKQSPNSSDKLSPKMVGGNRLFVLFVF